jgi:hypothetical protein
MTGDFEFRGFISEVDSALGLMSAGDAGPYIACWADTAEVTLLGAFGTVERGSPAVAETLRWVASRFLGGALVPSYDVIFASGNTGYTVGTEQGVISIDGAEPVAMLIRVTHVISTPSRAGGRYFTGTLITHPCWPGKRIRASR